MVIQNIARYGEWESPITVGSVTSKSRALSSPRVHSGRTFYLETEETGNSCIVEISKDGLKDRLPPEYSASNTVYEYGGAAFDVMSDGRLMFSNKDNTVHVLDPDRGEVLRLVANPVLRYSNFNAHPTSAWVLAVEEDHERDTPDQVKNYVVAINGDTGKVKRIASGADFYYTPQFSPDGTKVAWLEWNHPYLPFNAAKLAWCDWLSDAEVDNFQELRDSEGAVEPRWGPDGTLYYGREINGYRQLFCTNPGKDTPSWIRLEGLEEAELGQIIWWQGSQTYCPLSKKHLIAAAVTHGAANLVLIDLQKFSWSQLAEPTTLSDMAFDAMARLSDHSALVIGSGTVTSQTLYRIHIDEESPRIEVIRKSSDEEFDPALYSRPEAVCFRAPEGTLPPLIIFAHGGPTGCAGPGLKLRTQFFTSRGYAFFYINYTGSTGYGREYRESLFGNWGITDADDAVECAEYFLSQGRVKPGGVGITGPSGGGYEVLQAMTRHPKTFTAGLCVCGVSNVKELGEFTHKLESKYIAALAIPQGTPDDLIDSIYYERSPIFHASQIEKPLMLIHGTKDTVVPIEQARAIVRVIEEGGGDIELVEAEGQGYTLDGSAKMWLEHEERWWEKTLVK
ncbi:hypothetical protein DL764_008441 [Monosporascus ibericus]|uniref:Peptidase S9 prolyl oligopeptidase catalytic domain-containing protein n=1 Tax=Monosporascus ibericus TaxID=155417 RepID=A0A4V1X994_9PEZI|nr:hypothetical protein DL764_008441 [Monosporascus ibericus]